jgi:hypothetical protein
MTKRDGADGVRIHATYPGDAGLKDPAQYVIEELTQQLRKRDAVIQAQAEKLSLLEAKLNEYELVGTFPSTCASRATNRRARAPVPSHAHAIVDRCCLASHAHKHVLALWAGPAGVACACACVCVWRLRRLNHFASHVLPVGVMNAPLRYAACASHVLAL